MTDIMELRNSEEKLFELCEELRPLYIVEQDTRFFAVDLENLEKDYQVSFSIQQLLGIFNLFGLSRLLVFWAEEMMNCIFHCSIIQIFEYSK